MSLDLETPLAFSVFLANNTNHRKVIIPSTFNMSKILKSLRTQESQYIICDQEFYELNVSEERSDDIREYTNNIKKVVVASSRGQKVGKSLIFTGDAVTFDPYTVKML